MRATERPGEVERVSITSVSSRVNVESGLQRLGFIDNEIFERDENVCPIENGTITKH
jgi:hypothetical protein